MFDPVEMMPLEKQEDILARLRATGITSVDDYTPFPKPFCVNPNSVKAIYLGCDPTNTKYMNRFEYAFALPDGRKYHFEQFVEGHRKQLEAIRLSWDQVYVQNLCQNYFTEETSQNKREWELAAGIWIPELQGELEQFHNDIPILLTSQLLLHVLLHDRKNARRAEEYYYCREGAAVPIQAEHNKLSCPLIPLYRHPKYNLSNWKQYGGMVCKHLNNAESV
ncbi:MAG: hypothetical protein C0417_00955 [Chlorobiaceae bacterium]|nr:hypothetical protein [Chlorobiaceae bacterium]